MTTASKPFYLNNFDLIRLVAAIQVVLVHCLVHLSPLANSARMVNWMELLPGVPIFFFT